MAEIRTFNRFELKYLIPIELVETLKDHFSKYMKTDDNGDDSGWYSITSLYYDSDDYRCYWEKIEWLKYRRKLRIRYYEWKDKLRDDDIVFAEIKQRVDRVTQKRRVPLPRKDAKLLCNQREIPEHDSKDSATVQEIAHFAYEYNLQPTCITSYFRQAWVWTDKDPWLRITFDTNIRERHKDLDLASKKIGQVMIPLNMSVMEVKANEHLPFWIIELISKYSLRLVRVSKYCQGMETAQRVNESVFHIY